MPLKWIHETTVYYAWPPFLLVNTSSPGSIHLARILSATSAETSAFIVGVARGDPLRDALFAKASLQYYNVMQILAIVQGLDSTGGCSWGGKKGKALSTMPFGFELCLVNSL